jgi:GT2 family glycosyltransferase
LTVAPRFSIITPVYRPSPKVFRAMLESAQLQTFGDWEHCLVDDNSGDPEVAAILAQAAAADPRVRVHHRAENGGIVAATNDGLHMSTAEFVAFLDHDDELSPDALEKMAAAIDEHADADYLYSDEDKIDSRGRHFRPFVKPGWSPDRLRAQMYAAHFRVIRRSIADEVGGLRSGFDGSQDWDLALRIAERSQHFVRVPGFLYHWRTTPGSAAGATEAKPWAHEAAFRAVSEHLQRTGVAARPERIPEVPGHFWLRPEVGAGPKVSIGIASRKQPQALAAGLARLVAQTSYEDYELVVAVDEDLPKTGGDHLRRAAGERLRLVSVGGMSGTAARLNAAARESDGEHLLLLGEGADVPLAGDRPVSRRPLGQLPEWTAMCVDGRVAWIEAMLVFARQRGVGAVGAKVLRSDGRMAHAGIAFRDGRPILPYLGQPGDGAGYLNNLLVPCNYSAVSGVCLMTPRAVFLSVDGLDESLPGCEDIDYCLKLRRDGLRSVVVPQVELISDAELELGPAARAALRDRWGEALDNDPYYPDAFFRDNFNLPSFNRRGEFQGHVDLLAYLDRARRTLSEGGLRLLANRTYGKLRHELGERTLRAK